MLKRLSYSAAAINGEAQIPGRKVMPWQEDTSQKVLGSNPVCTIEIRHHIYDHPSVVLFTIMNVLQCCIYVF